MSLISFNIVYFHFRHMYNTTIFSQLILPWNKGDVSFWGPPSWPIPFNEGGVPPPERPDDFSEQIEFLSVDEGPIICQKNLSSYWLEKKTTLKNTHYQSEQMELTGSSFIKKKKNKDQLKQDNIRRPLTTVNGSHTSHTSSRQHQQPGLTISSQDLLMLIITCTCL